jgi:hypothetical protein
MLPVEMNLNYQALGICTELSPAEFAIPNALLSVHGEATEDVIIMR